MISRGFSSSARALAHARRHLLPAEAPVDADATQFNPLPDPVSVETPGIELNTAWKAALPPQEPMYWWQRSVLSLEEEKRAAREEAKRLKEQKRAQLLSKARAQKLRKLRDVYHAAKTFPMGDRQATLEAIDAEFLGRTPDLAPLPLKLEKLLQEASDAGKEDDAKGLITQDKVANRAKLFDQFDERRLADDEMLTDTVQQYAAHIGKGLHGKRSSSRAARIFDALHGTSDLGRQASLGELWKS